MKWNFAKKRHLKNIMHTCRIRELRQLQMLFNGMRLWIVICVVDDDSDNIKCVMHGLSENENNFCTSLMHFLNEEKRRRRRSRKNH